jgi:transposase
MILHPENWMNIRRFRALHEAGASYAEIAAEVGCDWRTVKKYLAQGSPAVPPAGSPRKGTQPRKIGPFADLVESWLRADITLRASVICERLTASYGFTGSYQRVKAHVAEVRPKIAAELAASDENPLAGLHRRFEVVAGAQAQVDWGEESGVLIGTPKVYSFHMVLSYSRDPFCCYTARTDLATFFACHIRAFEYFGGVPGSVVYDRTKTVVKRHVAPGQAVPLHPEAAAFAGHYGFDIDVLAAYRPMGKGRVERQVDIVRAHVLAGRAFCSLAEMDAAFAGWAVIRRGQVHRTHGEVIGVRAAADHAALRPLPAVPYLVAEQHLRRVGKDSLVWFEASLYSVPARQVRPFQTVQVRAAAGQVAIYALPGGGGGLLAVHARAPRRGSYVVDQAHWDGLPDGHTRAVTAGGPVPPAGQAGSRQAGPADPLGMLLAAHPAAAAPVTRRPLSDYDQATRP